MTEGQKGWILLFLLSIALIIMGVQGSAGVAFAIVFCPKYVTISE